MYSSGQKQTIASAPSDQIPTLSDPGSVASVSASQESSSSVNRTAACGSAEIAPISGFPPSSVPRSASAYPGIVSLVVAAPAPRRT